MVLVLMVRHGQRIDETPAGDAWLAKNSDRWFDPPLTDDGKRQARRAANILKKFLSRPDLAPLPRVYCSPLVRTLQTAEQFGQVLGLPLKPLAGCASCTAAFKTHGPKGQPLIPHADATAMCNETGVEVEEYENEYACEEAIGYQLAIEELVRQAQTHHLKSESMARDGSHGEAVSEEHISGSQMNTAKPVIVVVTHREGLRDTSQFTAAPFRSTPYCCVAAFEYTCGEKVEVSLVAKPDDFEQYARDGVAVDSDLDSGEEVAVVDWNAEGEENTNVPAASTICKTS